MHKTTALLFALSLFSNVCFAHGDQNRELLDKFSSRPVSKVEVVNFLMDGTGAGSVFNVHKNVLMDDLQDNFEGLVGVRPTPQEVLDILNASQVSSCAWDPRRTGISGLVHGTQTVQKISRAVYPESKIGQKEVCLNHAQLGDIMTLWCAQPVLEEGPVTAYQMPQQQIRHEPPPQQIYHEAPQPQVTQSQYIVTTGYAGDIAANLYAVKSYQEKQVQIITVSGEPGKDGAQGPAGQDGQDGRDGADGAQGPAGQDGRDGADGAQGPAGQDGRDGVDGAQGPQGDRGNTGATGPQGPQGPKGDKGDTGDTGAPGQPAPNPGGPQNPGPNEPPPIVYEGGPYQPGANN